jgi:5-methylcytosine-specific restriction enzyme subunit McrC
MKIPVRNVYFLLLYAWDRIGEEEERLVDDVDFTRLQDVFAHVLADTVARLLARGLDRDYVEAEEAVAGVRGKLDLSVTLKRGLLTSARTYCRFDELQHDVLQNRILKATLRSLLAVDLNASLRSRIGRLHRKMDAVSDVPISLRDFRMVRLHRNNRAYDFALRLCRLIHDNLMISESTGQAKFRDFRRDDRQMAALFEAFAFNFFRREQSRFCVTRPLIRWHDAQGSETDLEWLPSMRTDMVLEAQDRCIVLDTKYYTEALKRTFSKRKVRSGHLYQIFAYVENRAANFPGRPPHEGMLVYPVVEKAFAFDYRLKGRRITVRSIGLDQPWPKIHEDMLALLA